MTRIKFIRCEDGSYVYVRNLTRLSLSTDYDDKTKIKAHTVGPAMPHVIASFDSAKDAQFWLMDLVDRIENSWMGPKAGPGGVETR